MSTRLFRLIVLISVFVAAVVPARAFHFYSDIVSVSCNPAGFAVIDWALPFAASGYTLQALESTTTYTLPAQVNGSTTTTWTNGTFNIEIVGPSGLDDTATITCHQPVSGTGVNAEPAAERVAPPPPETWEGASTSTTGNYDGRINASKADRYAVYCKAGELQVWDGVNGVKVGSIAYAAIEVLANPVSVAIGDNVFLGRSNNVLGVVIPGEYENLAIELDRCISGGYDR